MYSGWAYLKVSAAKSLCTGILYKTARSGLLGNSDPAGESAASVIRQRLHHAAILQGSPATIIKPTDPFTYLGVIYTMNLDWSHQINKMTTCIREKLLNLEHSYLPYRHSLKVIKSAVLPSLAYAFPVVPCTDSDLA